MSKQTYSVGWSWSFFLQRQQQAQLQHCTNSNTPSVTHLQRKNKLVNSPFNSLHTNGEGKQMFPLCRISAGDMADQDRNLWLELDEHQPPPWVCCMFKMAPQDKKHQSLRKCNIKVTSCPTKDKCRTCANFLNKMEDLMRGYLKMSRNTFENFFVQIL